MSADAQREAMAKTRLRFEARAGGLDASARVLFALLEVERLECQSAEMLEILREAIAASEAEIARKATHGG